MDIVSRGESRGFSFDVAATWSLAVTIGLAIIAIIPFGNIPFLYTKVSLLAVGTIITLALFILARLTRGNIILPPLTLLGAMWLVPVAYGLSALFADASFGQSFFGAELETDTFGFVLLSALLGTLAAVVLRRREQLSLFFKVGTIVAAVVLVAELGFIIAGQIMPESVSATANLVGSFADLGMLIGLAISIALLALRFLPVSSRMTTVLYVGGVFGLFILALVNSSVLWVLVGLVALGLFIEGIMSRRGMDSDDELSGVITPSAESSGGEQGSSMVLPLIVLVVSLFFLIGGATIGNALTNTFNASLINVTPSWSSTFATGGHTYASSPLFGTGPGSFGEEWLKYRDAALNDTVFWSLDFNSGVGFIPTSFVTTGAIGALAWLAFLGLLLFLGIRFLLMRAPEDPTARFAALASFVAAVYLFTLLTFAVPGPIVTVLAFVAVGVFISSMRYGMGAQEWGVAFARSPRIGFLIVFCLTLLLLGSVLGVYVVTERYLANVSYANGSAALSSGNLEGAARATSQSIMFAPSDRAYRLMSSVGIARLNQIAADENLSQDQARTEFQAALSGAVSDALTATQLGPNNYLNWTALGDVYSAVVPLGIDQAYENAKTAYEKAVSLNPTNPVLPYILAQLEIANEDTVAAEAYLNQAISLKNDYTQAIFLLSQLQVQQGKAAEALQAAEAAAYFAPNDPVVLFQVGLLRLGTDDAEGAVAALSTAVSLNPEYANAHYFLAIAHATLAQYEEAIAELEIVSSLSPENAEAVAGFIATLRTNKNPFPPTTFAEQPLAETTTAQ